MSDDFTEWLRRQITGDLEEWRATEAALLPGVPREGEVLWSDARERADGFEALLGILDAHYILTADDRSEAYEEFSVVRIGAGPKDRGCVTCHYYGTGGVKGYGWCRTVRMLGSAYRHRLGYREEWKP